ncbi:hypothetical protein OsJ_08856 [Oryza sativa Japonica Group]|uniref:Uncharacterized protein n=1 Tax=Oryza sativa subsp. japonica TaxID=39947 RepID=B9F471_ORYSJ|nr:hypothetical protein OsJ_08856 [Oryza sativa Japonica Group]
MSAGGRHRDDCSASPPPSPSPPPSTLLQLLEVTVISAQDLHRRLGRRVRAAYAVPRRDSPDAFSVKDLLVRRPGSLARIVEVSETEEADDEPPAAAAAVVEHSGAMDTRGLRRGAEEAGAAAGEVEGGSVAGPAEGEGQQPPEQWAAAASPEELLLRRRQRGVGEVIITRASRVLIV